uniref:Mucin-17 n=2 Tax=Myotis myotis TaxID=51298 RepID=A0A7J7XZV3_MYOMY|nr:hypothetical protein mMyoMyo1_011442 [Myotis myotis]
MFQQIKMSHKHSQWQKLPGQALLKQALKGQCHAYSQAWRIPVPCYNGGTWNGKVCECLPGFGGDQCQHKTPICQNGGRWDGTKCVCTSLYQGPRCEDVITSIDISDIKPPEDVSAQVELSVTVTNKEFTEELNNRSSTAFLDFEKTFTQEMDKVYSGIPAYAGVNITELSPGSVVVQHDIILQAKFSPEYKEEFKKFTQEIEKKIMNVTQQQIMRNNTCTTQLCFNTTATEVKNVSITQYNPEEVCRERAGKDLAKYFFVEYKDLQPNCINRCMPGFKASMDCHFGTCKLERSGPKCYCLNTNTDWYSGETCEVSTKKSLVYGLVGAAGAVVLVALVILLVFVFRSKREVKRQKAKVTELYNWHEEDGGPAPGTFQNIGFDIYEEPNNSINLDSIYSNFQPSLDHIDSKTKIKIRRPEVMMESF